MRVYLLLVWTLVSGIVGFFSSFLIIHLLRGVLSPLTYGEFILVWFTLAAVIMFPLLRAGIRVLKIVVARRNGQLVVISLLDQDGQAREREPAPTRRRGK